MKPLAKTEGGSPPSFSLLETNSYIVVDNETLFKNIQSSLERGLPSLVGKVSPHFKKALIVAGGPSLKTELRDIRKHKDRGGVIFSVNGTHDYLIKHKIVPDYMVMVDPKESNKRFVQNPNKRVEYLIGSCCDPAVFDNLQGQNVKLWHPILKINEENQFTNVPMWIGGGTTVGLRAISVGYVLGFRDFLLFGFDGCLKGEDHHAYKQPENDEKKIIDVWFKGKEYFCHIWMATQAQDFIDFLKINGSLMKIKIHTPGLIKAISQHIGEYYAS